MSPNKKVTKEVGIGEALYYGMIATGNHYRFDRCAVQQPSPVYPTRHLAIRPAKMFRFLQIYREKTFQISQM